VKEEKNFEKASPKGHGLLEQERFGGWIAGCDESHGG